MHIFTQNELAGRVFNGMAVHRNVLVIFDEDKDPRVFRFVDEMDPKTRKKLCSIQETEGCINLVWRSEPPPKYKIGALLDAPCDVWTVNWNCTVLEKPKYHLTQVGENRLDTDDPDRLSLLAEFSDPNYSYGPGDIVIIPLRYSRAPDGWMLPDYEVNPDQVGDGGVTRAQIYKAHHDYLYLAQKVDLVRTLERAV